MKIGFNNITTFIGDSRIVLSNKNYMSRQDLEYINTNVSKIAVKTTQNTATFNSSIKQPAGGSDIPSTTKYNFQFYVNGVYIPHEAIQSLVDYSTYTVLTVDISLLGYDIKGKEIQSIGKWNN